MEVSPFEAVPERKELHLKLDARTARAGIIKELAELLRAYPGDAAVFVAMTTSAGAQTLELGPGYRVQAGPDLFAEVKALLGPSSGRLDTLDLRHADLAPRAEAESRRAPLVGREGRGMDLPRRNLVLRSLRWHWR